MMSLGRKASSGIKTPSGEMAAKAEEKRAAEFAKTTRLRALRLAKEAADREAMQRAAPPPRAPRSIRLRRANEAV
jgi:hypothetical protein